MFTFGRPPCYNVVNSYLFERIDETITILVDALKHNAEVFKTCVKLTLTGIHNMAELCVSRYYFLHRRRIRLSDNAGLTGLSLMLTLFQSYRQSLEHKARNQLFTFRFRPETICKYADNSYTGLQSENEDDNFLHILNKHDPAFQYMIKYEDHNKSLDFLDSTSINSINDKYALKVFCKDTSPNNSYLTSRTDYML